MLMKHKNNKQMKQNKNQFKVKEENFENTEFGCDYRKTMISCPVNFCECHNKYC